MLVLERVFVINRMERNGRMAKDFRLMCVGDIHLGRRPTRLASRVADLGVGIHELTPAAAWHAAVEWALANQVDAVALAGDVVESLEDRFEAFGHLERGVRRLTEANISVIGVAGNHDVYALPRLADQLPEFTLLGRGGKWESVELTGASGARLCILGWSFQDKCERRNPVDELPPGMGSSMPTVGLLHCDLDQTNSPYAPVPRRSFQNAPGIAWFLGHVHSPSDLSGPRPVGYLGSLVGLDPGEPGLHGPWLACISDGAPITLEHLPLAPLRWEAASVAIDEIDDAPQDEIEDALSGVLVAGMEAIHLRIEPTLGTTRLIGCRLHLTGRSRSHRKLQEAAGNENISKLTRSFGSVVYFVDKIFDEAAPALELERLAQTKDLPGLLAQRILVLQQGGIDSDRLVAQALGVLDEAGKFAAHAVDDEYSGHEPVSPDEGTRQFLVAAGMQALEELLTQRGISEGNHIIGGQS
ncbi:MAG: exonuclease SbcD [Halieaceae bacterium]|jgi:exonuclease SbcD